MSESCCGKSETPQKAVNASEGQITSIFKVSGMDCADEIKAIENSLKLTGIAGINANLMNETVTVIHDKSMATAMIVDAINKSGVKVVKSEEKSFYRNNSNRILIVIASGVLLSIGLVLDWLDSSAILQEVLFGLAILLSGSLVIPKTIRALKQFSLDMNVLMTIAVIGAFCIKEYSEAASVVFLFALAELLEAMSVEKARKAIKEVLKITPKEATLLGLDGKTERKDVAQIQINDLVLVRPGDNISIDGIIEDGSSAVNQSSLTGESKPVSKTKGDEVLAGTINDTGVLKVRVTKLFADTKIAQIVSLIENAQKDKAPSQRFVDKFASIYTPAVLLLAILVALIPPVFMSASWDLWIYKSLVLLVIGCPCALVIATPVSVVSGLTSLAKRGILVKGGIHLESLGKIKAIALDKTGTITEGLPTVNSVKLFSNTNEEECIKITASLESMSSHPLALAILKYAKEKNISYIHPENFRVIVGKGAEGDLNGHSYFVGNHNLGHELGVCTPEVEQYLDSVETKSMSVIVLGHKPHKECAGEILAIFALGDKIRPGIEEVIKSFHKAGIQSVSILSGDNQKTVSAVAKLVGIDEAKGGLLPDGKVLAIKDLLAKYQFVGMVGDGVNDAPALATATLGIAMGIVGSDTAIETADVALMKDDISTLPKAIIHGRRVLNMIRFNIGFAIAIKAVFFVLAFIGVANLWLAVAADMGASLFVTFNALRLLKIEE